MSQSPHRQHASAPSPASFRLGSRLELRQGQAQFERLRQTARARLLIRTAPRVRIQTRRLQPALPIRLRVAGRPLLRRQLAVARPRRLPAPLALPRRALPRIARARVVMPPLRVAALRQRRRPNLTGSIRTGPEWHFALNQGGNLWGRNLEAWGRSGLEGEPSRSRLFASCIYIRARGLSGRPCS